MAIAITERRSQGLCSFPLLKVITSGEDVPTNSIFVLGRERCQRAGLVTSSTLLYESLSRAAGFTNEQRAVFAGQLSEITTHPLTNSLNGKLDRIVQQVVGSEVVNNFHPSSKSRTKGTDQLVMAERWIGNTKAMETALNALVLLLQLKLNIPSKQAIKREARVQTEKRYQEFQAEKKKLPADSYRRTIKALAKGRYIPESAVPTPEAVSCYQEWLGMIKQKSESIHKRHLKLKEDLDSLLGTKKGGLKMTAEMVTEQPRATKPELPEVATARLLMGRCGRVRFEVPSYFNLDQHPEFRPFVDQERSNGRTWLKFTDAQLAGSFMHFRNRAAEELVKQSEEETKAEYRRDVLRQNGLEH